MIAFALAIGAIGFAFFVGIAFGTWVIHEHRQAKQWRHLIHLHNTTPIVSKADQWKVTYKQHGKLISRNVTAKTEGEALREVLITGVNKIESIVKL